MRERPDGLFTLTTRAIASIDALDARPDGPCVAAFAAQLRSERPELFASLGGEAEPVARALAAAMLRSIKEIPQIVDAMRSAVDRPTTDPAVRCALAGALAYLVQPRDLLPDDLPAGFGFIDDCVILRATVTEFLEFLPRGFTTAERERRLLRLLAVAIPPPRLPLFQAAVEEIWLAFHALLWRAEDDIDETTARILADPLVAPLPVPERESIPLPPGPRLSMAPGGETLLRDGTGVRVTFAVGDDIRITAAGELADGP